MSDRICRKCARELGANMKDETVHTMSLEKCARCGKKAYTCRAVKWGVAYGERDEK